MQWHLLGLINRGMNEEARQDLETNIRSSDKSEWTIEEKLTWVTGRTTRRAWRHTFTKSDWRQEGLSTDVNECWPLRSATLTKRIEALGSCLLVSRDRDPYGQRHWDRDGTVYGGRWSMEVRVTVYLNHKSWSSISKTLQSLRSLVSLEKSLNFLQLWIVFFNPFWLSKTEYKS